MKGKCQEVCYMVRAPLSGHQEWCTKESFKTMSLKARGSTPGQMVAHMLGTFTTGGSKDSASSYQSKKMQCTLASGAKVSAMVGER